MFAVLLSQASWHNPLFFSNIRVALDRLQAVRLVVDQRDALGRACVKKRFLTSYAHSAYPPQKVETVPDTFSFPDNPGIALVAGVRDPIWGRTIPLGASVLYKLSMDFELHFVGLAGLERGVTYGGVKWGFEFQLKFKNFIKSLYSIDQYRFTSYANEVGAASQKWKEIWSANQR